MDLGQKNLDLSSKSSSPCHVDATIQISLGKWL